MNILMFEKVLSVKEQRPSEASGGDRDNGPGSEVSLCSYVGFQVGPY